MKKKFFILSLIVIGIVLSLTIIRYSPHSTNQDDIYIGTIFPMSGDWANYGEQMANGVRLWEILHPESHIKICYEDGQGNVPSSLAAFKKLFYTNRVKAVISGVSPVMLGIAPLSDKNNIFTINAGATNPDIKLSSENIFCIIPDANIEAAYIADFLVDSLNRKTCYVYWKNDDSGRGMLNSFKRQYIRNGGIISGDEAITTETIKPSLLKIKQSNAKTVFIPTNGEMIAKIMHQAYSMGMNDILWVGYAAAESPELIQELQNLSAPKFIFSSYAYKSSSSSLTTQFIENYRSTFGVTPQYYSATCYDAISLIALAINNGCKTSNEIKEYVYALQSFDGVSGTLEIGGHNYVSSGMNFNMYINNSISPINTQLFNVSSI